MKRAIRAIAWVGLACLSAGPLGAQAPAATANTFEVASIRRNASVTTGGAGSRMEPGGSYIATNLTLQQLIAVAYDVPPTRVFDGPGWASADRYDIVARAAGNPSARDAAPLVRALLRDRFNLAVRQEMREFPIYALVKARPDASIGPRLWASEGDCADRRTLPTGLPGDLTVRPVCRPPLVVEKDIGMFVAGDVPISTLAQVLGRASGRPVLDRTGLIGRVDVSLEWASRPEVDGVSIFTAVQEQLGLRLESTSAPLDVVIIERADRPTEN